MQIGFIGLGKMGSRMVQKLLNGGHEVVVWNRSEIPLREFQSKVTSERLQVANGIKDLVSKLEKPRIIWLMLTAGEATESVLTELAKYVESEDIVIDGGNAHFKDTQRRYETFQMDTISYLGIGVSGGVLAVDNGYPLMVGGTKSAYDHITPLLDTLSNPHGGHTYFGEGGAGHFVKMVHNGIEYGMMQSIAEGFGVLDKGAYTLDLVEVAKLWQKGTIISSFLIDRAKDALEKDPELSQISGIVDASGEGEWTVQQGKESGVPVENIEQSLVFRKRSQVEKEVSETFAAKMVAALRHEFGGHRVHAKNITEEH